MTDPVSNVPIHNPPAPDPLAPNPPANNPVSDNPLAPEQSNKEFIDIKDVSIGDVLYQEVFMDSNDIVNVNSKSASVKKTAAGGATKRQVLVLAKPDSETIIVTYFATFGSRKAKLPEAITDKTLWYPIIPAIQESIHIPAEMVKGVNFDERPQWASLRKIQVLHEKKVERLVGYRAGDGTVAAIANAMHQ